MTTAKLLLAGLPIDDENTINTLIKDLLSVEGVIDIQKKHFWALSTGYLICNISFKVKKDCKEEIVL